MFNLYLKASCTNAFFNVYMYGTEIPVTQPSANKLSLEC